MNILYNSRDKAYKTPFGPVWAGQDCRICIHIPAECGAFRVILTAEGLEVPLEKQEGAGDYDLFGTTFAPDTAGLYFYCFHIWDKNGDYDLFKAGDGTNIGLGDRWQLSVLPADYRLPESYRGAVYYQIFPDRFAKSGDCDLTDKMEPYILRDFDGFVPATRDASDFAGGNLNGITEKLDYIAGLGVNVVYLNPIFMAASNHRYDTADYTRIDPMLGTEEDFVRLCREAHSRGLRVVLDGVFSHTGRDSVYFDGEKRFGGGAVSAGTGSPYYKWYDFQEFPSKYTCWWGFDTLPCVNELDPDYMEFILGEQGVVAKWLRLGADGFRLDVADELPDAFIAALRRRVKAEKPEAVVIGEVWEDVSNKVSYGVRRTYFTGAELDGAINYPFRKPIMAFASGREGGEQLAETVMTIAENYPAGALDCCMTVLGSHDTQRIGTLLPRERERRVAAFLQFALPGSPLIYYGDEAGMTGGPDPMCRLPFPWGREDEKMQALYRSLAQMKNSLPALRVGDIHFEQAGNGRLTFIRTGGGQTVRCTVNRDEGTYEAAVL
ncbi:MAG: glycoside hydrolase family 13 protein [Oscillospiraceae bacterium]|nr:glycoside hydrolase family 13 protein [Oscillospiraceae bacterium]